MKFGVADYGMNVWYGGLFDVEERLSQLKHIGFDGTERLEANGPADALHKAALYRRLGMDFALCRGPDVQATIRWTAALGKDYVWTQVGANDFDSFCRQVNEQVRVCNNWGVRVGLHNHLGSLVETQEQVEEFLKRCPDCGLVFDTAHLAGANGDCMEIARKYPDRIVALHLKDWFLTDPDADAWPARGRFCELGAGNVGLDNVAVLRALVDAGFDGWVHIEQDTHLRDPLQDLAHSRRVLREAGF